MQKKLLLLAAFTCLSFLGFAQSSTNSRNVSDIMRKLTQMVDLAEADGNEVVRMEADLISGEKSTTRTLTDSWTYTIMAAGSDRIEDLDIVVYKLVDGEWVEVGKDNDHSSVAAVSVKPSATAQYKIVVKAYKFKPGNTVGHYGLIIYHP